MTPACKAAFRVFLECVITPGTWRVIRGGFVVTSRGGTNIKVTSNENARLWVRVTSERIAREWQALRADLTDEQAHRVFDALSDAYAAAGGRWWATEEDDA